MEQLLRDVRFAFRMLAKNFSITAIMTLALAVSIGMSTSIFSVVNAVLLRQLSFEKPDQLVMLYSSNQLKGVVYGELSPADFIDYKNQNRSLDQVSALRFKEFTLTGLAEPDVIQGASVSANFFSLLGVIPVAGRTFLSDEDLAGKNRVAVISYGLWQRRFGGDPRVIQRAVTLDGESYTIVGVLRPDFEFPKSGEQAPPSELWVPLALTSDDLSNRRNHILIGVGRLKTGVRIEQARQDLVAIAGRLEQDFPQSNLGWSVSPTLLTDRVIGNTKTSLLVLLGAVGLLLIITCANVANLLLAKAATRGKEIAIRSALGATRRVLVRQLLTESAVLALAGGTIGVLLTIAGIHILTRVSAGYIPRVNAVSVDGTVLAFALVISLLTGLICGIAPALKSSKTALAETLKEGGRGDTSGVARSRLRAMLVVSEVALSLVLLISAGLLIKSFVHLLNVKPGFNAENLLTMEISLPVSKYRKPDQRLAFFEQLFRSIPAVPGVRSVSGTNHLPLSGTNSSFSFFIKGRAVSGTGEAQLTTNWRAVTPDYFRTMEIPLLKGRVFSDFDRQETPLYAVISETMAKRYWPNEDPLGKELTIGGAGASDPPVEIIGVVGDVKHWGLDAEERAQLYISHLQEPPLRMTVIVRTTSDPTSLAATMRREVLAIDKNQPVNSVRTMEDVLADSVSRRRFVMLMLSIFASIALILAVVGLYGVVSYIVAQRRHEIGLRIALGAQAKHILKLVVGQGVTLALVGVAIGLAAAFAFTRVLLSLLYGISATDVITFVGGSLLLLLVTLLASYIPAIKAMKVDPMIALRQE
jgi:putative ABC transport system permease protein